MIGKNNSYFDRELCLDGHYIVTGYTNDLFCNDMLQLSKVEYELNHYLRYNQNFDAVFFLHSVDMLFCYDEQSYDILRGNRPQQQETQETQETQTTSASNIGDSILATTPLGRRRRRRTTEAPQQPQQATPTQMQQNTQQNAGPLHMGRQSITWCWEQVTSLLRRSEYRCALVLSNVDSLINSMGVQEMTILEELQSYHSTNNSIVIYMFRDTSLCNLVHSVEQSRGGASNQWSRFVENVLLSRIQTGNPNTNRVISLRTPNSKEIQNLLNYLRLREQNPLAVVVSDIPQLSEVFSASCARQQWGLHRLFTRLDLFIGEKH
ncbi:MAG: hypothetical protein IKJ01_06785, partial [Lachnospiraceae bacterium]|nr:hypothetical protein [Lachnospiraceae bacterium]